jgi:hypothetical protein
MSQTKAIGIASPALRKMQINTHSLILHSQLFSVLKHVALSPSHIPQPDNLTFGEVFFFAQQEVEK